MYREHPCCSLPDDKTIVWRYFDFAKFMSLLDRSALFFPSARQLEDPFEGSLPLVEKKWAFLSEGSSGFRRLRRQLMMISSWHMNQDESFAMWRLYSKSVEAVAIQTTLGRLKESFRFEACYSVHIGQVEYLDYTQDKLESRHHLAPYLCKPKPYAYENEIRAIVDLCDEMQIKEGASMDVLKRHPLLNDALNQDGVYVRTNLETLIEGLYVSPSAGGWFLELVQSMLKRFKIELEPKHSVLTVPPHY